MTDDESSFANMKLDLEVLRMGSQERKALPREPKCPPRGSAPLP